MEPKGMSSHMLPRQMKAKAEAYNIQKAKVGYPMHWTCLSQVVECFERCRAARHLNA
jgi:hypothetical protein